MEEKNVLSKLGIRIGAKYFFVPNFLKKASMELSAILWCVFNKIKFDGLLPLPKNGRVSFTLDNEMQESYWPAIGYLKLKNFALRIDVFERIFFLARQKIKIGPFLDSADLMNPVGCNKDQLEDILLFCGFKSLKLINNRNLYFFESKKILTKSKNLKSKKISLFKKPKITNIVNNKKITKSNKTTNNKTSNNKITNNNKNIADPNSPFAVLEKLL